VNPNDPLFRLVLEQSPLSVQIFDAEGNAVFANASWEKIWESRREDLAGYNGLRDAQLESMGLMDKIHEAFAGKGTDLPATLYDPQKNGKTGRPRWVTAVLYPVMDDAARVLAVVLIHRDITDRALAEQALLGANSELRRRTAEDSDRLKETAREIEMLSRSMSQDLRAPARHIGGFLELLRSKADAALDAESRRYLDIISDSVHRLDSLITDLVAFSNTGQRELHKIPCNMTALVTQCIRDRKLALSGQGREIAWVIGDLPECRADLGLMREVWGHLIGNAVKFTEGVPDARIEIGTEKDPAHPEAHTYFIRDNGAGFDPHYAGKLFGLFQRLHGTEEFPGSGIGLATVRRIVHRHRGRVRAEGDIGKGVTVRFSIPA
jgi:PAS domain S-box-containing protein